MKDNNPGRSPGLTNKNPPHTFRLRRASAASISGLRSRFYQQRGSYKLQRSELKKAFFGGCAGRPSYLLRQLSAPIWCCLKKFPRKNFQPPILSLLSQADNLPSMNWNLLGPMLVTILVAIGGWIAGHTLSARRDRLNKRREQRIGYLIEAYRRLESCARRGDKLDFSKLESAIADIQLFGTAKQVELVQSFAIEFAAKGETTMDELLQDLRRDLRDELKLEVAP